MIKINKYPELSEYTKNKLSDYIKAEFGHIPIVQKTEWAVPNWTIIYYENEEIASFYNIVERKVIIDKNKFRVAGINNVITPIQFRAKGYASKILAETEYFISDNLDCDLGLLLCADSLVPFYERLNWYKVDCPVNFKQSDGVKQWSANTMLLTKNKKLNPKRMDLNGLPW